jgi:hypothetical protein
MGGSASNSDSLGGQWGHFIDLLANKVETMLKN